MRSQCRKFEGNLAEASAECSAAASAASMQFTAQEGHLKIFLESLYRTGLFSCSQCLVYVLVNNSVFLNLV